MKPLIFILIFLPYFGAAQSSPEEIARIRNQHLTELLDSTAGILTADEIKEFGGLSYFDFDPKFQIKAKFTKSIGKKFKMPTTTDRMPIYCRFGYVDFVVDSIPVRLTVYQNMALKRTKKYKNYLFIPFRDGTSGKETYGGGRYLDLEIPNNDEILLDFNLAYNPYCAYSYRYSCPIPPAENTININILAGEKSPINH